VNRFLFRHPVLGALALAGGFVGIVVLGGSVADRAPFAAILIAVVILLVMVLAGNRHFS
jgi:hypothetical protein